MRLEVRCYNMRAEIPREMTPQRRPWLRPTHGSITCERSVDISTSVLSQSFTYQPTLILTMGVFERKHGQWVADLAIVIAAVRSLLHSTPSSPTNTSTARTRLLPRAPTHIPPRSRRLRQKRSTTKSPRRHLPPAINLPISRPRR